jgi:hypothetical protein
MISIGYADILPMLKTRRDGCFRTAVIARSVGGAISQGAHAFPEVIRLRWSR